MSNSQAAPPAASGGSASPVKTGSWHEYKSADGRSYWAHSVTKQSVWEKPDELKSPFERAMGKTPWKQYTSKGRAYYVHSGTKETKWDLPSELHELKKQIAEEEKEKEEAEAGLLKGESGSPEPSARQGVAETNTQALTVNGHLHSNQERDGSPTPSEKQEEENKDNVEDIGEEDIGPPPIVPMGGFSTAQDAERAFVYLLKKAKVDETWTWDVTMRKIITDPLYKSLNTLAEKKNAWQRYIHDLKANQAAIRQAKLDRLRPYIRKLLSSHPRIKAYSTFKTAESLFENNKYWKEIKQEEDRRKLFEEYVGELRKQDAAAEEELKKRNNALLESLMKDLPITVATRWREARELIISSPQFKVDEKLQAIEDVDIIILFEAYSLALLKEHEEQLRKANSVRLRRARKARDGFRALLSEMEAKGHLKSKTKWKDFLKLIQDRPEYEELLGMPGSSPLELWEDAVDDIGEAVDSAVKKINGALDKAEKEVTVETTSEEFKELVKSIGVVVDDKYLDEAFEVVSDSRMFERSGCLSTDHDSSTTMSLRSLLQIQNQLEKAAREEQKKAERKRRHQMEDLRYAMKKAEPAIDLDGTYEDAIPSMSKIKEFDMLDDEGRKETFEKFIRRQKEKLREAEEGSSGRRPSEQRRESGKEQRERSTSPRASEGRQRRDRERGSEPDREREREHATSREQSRDRYRDDRDRNRDRVDRERERERDREGREERHHRTSRDDRTRRYREDDEDHRAYRKRRNRVADEGLPYSDRDDEDEIRDRRLKKERKEDGSDLDSVYGHVSKKLRTDDVK